MSKKFLEKIRKNKISHPFHRSFKIEKWINEYNNYLQEDINSNLDDVSIFQAGIIFHQILMEIRNSLENLYSTENPFSDYRDIIKFYFSISNRDKKILVEQTKEMTNNYFTKTLNNNILKNNLTIEDIANSSVDGISNAIFNCVKKINKGTELFVSKKPILKTEFIKKEAYLSQLYHSLENFWNLLIRLDYTFLTKKQDDETYYIIYEPESEYEIISIISNQRRERLITQRAYLSNSNEVVKNLIKQDAKFVNSKSFKVHSLSNNEKLLSSYISLLSQEIYLTDYFPKEYLNDLEDKEYNVIDILTIFKQLSLLAIQYTDSYKDENIGELEYEKLLDFCPIIKKIKLIKSLSIITGYTTKKIERILSFLEYKANKSDDLWANPIFSISESEYILLTSAIDSPNVLRTVERWFVKLELSLDKKGIYYENTMVNDFNNLLLKNKEIRDIEQAVSRNIKLNSKIEQVDFISRIGNKILLGEIKCIITSDSPLREFNTLERLKDEGSIQVNRKKKFIEENLQLVFKILKWKFDPLIEYEVVGFILNSNRTLVGLSLNNIPIIDKEILLNYFKANKSPIITIEKNGKLINIASFILYKNFEEMCENIMEYLKNPPPIILHKHGFKREYIHSPVLNKKSNKIVLSKLVSEKLDIKEIFSKSYSFSIEKIENFEDYLDDEMLFI